LPFKRDYGRPPTPKRHSEVRAVSRTPADTPTTQQLVRPPRLNRQSRKTGSVNHPAQRALTGTLARVTQLKIGYARVSTVDQDLTAQRDALTALGVEPDRVYVDHGITGTNRDRPGLRQALAACRRGDNLVVTMLDRLDRLARSVPDARDIADELTTAGVKLNIGGSVHDPTDPIGRLLFTTLAMIAQFEADLARARTREGMAVARAKGRLRGKQPKLSPRQEAHLVQLYQAGEHTVSEFEELFPVPRSTIYRAITRAGGPKTPGRSTAVSDGTRTRPRPNGGDDTRPPPRSVTQSGLSPHPPNGQAR